MIDLNFPNLPILYAFNEKYIEWEISTVVERLPCCKPKAIIFLSVPVSI